MTPRQLKYFVEIARTGSITTAASTLHIAQPALSHHIAVMEQELGVALLQRHARGVRLTAEGQRLWERAASILRQMERLGDDVREAGQSPRGIVRACVAGALSSVLAVPLLQALRERAPQIQLQLTTVLSREAQFLVETRRVDLALLPTAFQITQLEAIPLFEEDFCLFGAPQHMPGSREPVAFRELCALPLVAPDREHDLRQLMERTALAQNCALNVLYEINQAELLRSLVYGGLAFAVLPRNAFAARDEASVAARDIVEPRLSRIQSLAWSLDQPLSAAGKLVREVVLELVAAMVADGRLKGRLLAAGAEPGMGVEA